eukprot:5785021-Pyramimonas_sp.AAC.1
MGPPDPLGPRPPRWSPAWSRRARQLARWDPSRQVAAAPAPSPPRAACTTSATSLAVPASGRRPPPA